MANAIICSVLLLYSSTIVSKHSFICDLLKPHIPSAVTNFTGEQVLCRGFREGRDQEGKRCRVGVLIDHQGSSKHTTSNE